MTKRIFAVLTTLVLLCACLPLGAVNVSAATSGDFTYTISGNEVTITGYTTYRSESVVIPYSLEGKNVTKIGYRAFYDRNLTSVTIPDTVIEIGAGAFYKCTDLESVVIGDSVTKIGAEAFYNCTGLESVAIGDSVVEIGAGAFQFCSSLTSITLPDSVTTVGDRAFLCEKLTSFAFGKGLDTVSRDWFYDHGDYLESIKVHGHNPNFSSEDGVLFDANGSDLIWYPAAKKNPSYTVPDTVTIIREEAFYNCDNLTTVIIPDSVTLIEKVAFFECSSLLSVGLDVSVTAIKENAFLDCKNLTEVYYSGTEANKLKIVFHRGNESIFTAEWRFGVTDKGDDNQKRENRQDTWLLIVCAVNALATSALVVLLLIKKKKKVKQEVQE